MGLHRIEKRAIKKVKARKNTAYNEEKKRAERARRDARMAAKVKAGKLPFTPDVMSWLSIKLDKPSSKITQADLAKLAT
jgi:hypothetical protein